MPDFRRIFIFIAVLHVCLLSKGREFSFTNLSVEQGLSNNEVNTIFKDSYGFMWFGTLHGLDRYDGISIRSYASMFPDQIENVYSISEDSNNELWVGTSKGLFKQDHNTGRFNAISIDSIPIPIYSIVLLPDNNLFLGTNQGLYIFNTETLETKHFIFSNNKNSKSNYITEIWSDNHNNCWLSTQNGLVRFSTENQNYDIFFNETDEGNIFTSLCNIGNKIYLGTSNSGFVEFDIFLKKFSKGIDLGNNLIHTIDDDDKERLFIGTNGGGLKIVNIRTGEIRSIEKIENNLQSISSNSVYSFFLDEYERYWIGTYSGGINYSGVRLGNFNLHQISTKYPNINKSIRSFYFSNDGKEYIGTRNGLAVLGNQGQITVYSTNSQNNRLRSNIILSVFPHNNEILLGTYGGGISKLSQDDMTLSNFSENEVFTQGNTYDFEKDKDGNLWIATFNGIYKYLPNKNSLINYTKENSGLIDNRIFELKIDSKEQLWVGTMKGTSLFTFTGDSIIEKELPQSFKNNYKTNYIYEDQANNTWICTEVGGLYMIDPDLKSCKNYRDENGLPDNSTCAIIETSAGIYWVSSLKGFSKFILQDEKFINFSVSDGLPGLVFTPAATHISDDGKVFFGNEKGLVWFYPNEIDKKNINSNIIITDLYVSGRAVSQGDEHEILNMPIELTGEIELKYNTRNLGFRFVDLNYLNPFDNNYFYQLEGVDDDWQDNGNNNSVFYDNLKPGSYIFKVRNKAATNISSTNTIELKIVINKPFYRSPIVIFAFILLLLASAFFISRYIKKLLSIKSKYINEHKEAIKYKSSSLSDTEREDIIKKLTSYMKNKKPYLNPDLKLADIAGEINIPIHNISQAINQSLDKSFNDFVNHYRVEEVKDLMKSDTNQKFTLIAIATQSGFNSKTSFYRVFKKITGKTPNEYLNEIRD